MENSVSVETVLMVGDSFLDSWPALALTGASGDRLIILGHIIQVESKGTI